MANASETDTVYPGAGAATQQSAVGPAGDVQFSRNINLENLGDQTTYHYDRFSLRDEGRAGRVLALPETAPERVVHADPEPIVRPPGAFRDGGPLGGSVVPRRWATN
jgi:hypothetical protein